MQLDPFMHMEMHEQEIRRQVQQNAPEREARESRRSSTGSAGSLGARSRAAFRPLEVAGLLGALAHITGAADITRFPG